MFCFVYFKFIIKYVKIFKNESGEFLFLLECTNLYETRIETVA